MGKPRHATDPDRSENSSSSLDNFRGMQRQIKSKIPGRQVDFTANEGRAEIKIDYLDETDIANLVGLLAGVGDAPLNYSFDALEVFDGAHGDWSATGIPNSVLLPKYNREASVADNIARVIGKINGDSYISIGIQALSCMDAISTAYDRELTLFGRNKRVKGFVMALMC